MGNYDTLEKKLIHKLRVCLNQSESREEIAFNFIQIAQEMFNKATNGVIKAYDNDIEFTPDSPSYYKISPKFSQHLNDHPVFSEFEAIQFDATLYRLARQTAHHDLHFAKQHLSRKTNSTFKRNFHRHAGH